MLTGVLNRNKETIYLNSLSYRNYYMEQHYLK
jgi:hypothetical protein